MRDEIREQLSALADDELNQVERPLLLGRLQREPTLRACLGRYRLIGELMRGTGHAATLGIADRVQLQLAAEAALPAVATAARHALWWKPLAGLAVAASVALVAVVSVMSLEESRRAAVPSLANAGATSSPPPGLATTPNAAIVPVSEADNQQWHRLDPNIDKRLSEYLVNHNEYAASRGVQAVMPYVRIVGYPSSE
jgi:sigma-E factor negative regulatory protein RseA